MEESWASLEESEIMAHWLGAYSFPDQQGEDLGFGIQPLFWSEQEFNLDPYYCSSNECFSDQDVLSCINIGSAPMNVSALQDQTNTATLSGFPVHQFAEAICSNEEMGSDDLKNSSLKRKHDVTIDERKEDIPIENPKRVRASSKSKVQNSVKKAHLEKLEKNGSNGEEGESCYSSEDDSNASQELNRESAASSSSSKGSAALNLNGKARAGRGSATDPQSLYARKRRERINERLRVLQNLVPNGTKVDISTMLEEAADYVKFLQLQIKLLSSDDLWMYAPIAYNGMDIGLDLKISRHQQ